MCKILHGKELNNVIRADIFSFSYKMRNIMGQSVRPDPLQGIVMNQCTIRFFPFWMTSPL